MLFAIIFLFIVALGTAAFGYSEAASNAAEAGLIVLVVFLILAALLSGLGAIAIKQDERRRGHPA